ncbi:MAG: Rpn family recombination-promoting nuclease/putative transposase [Phocaeicola sp.]
MRYLDPKADLTFKRVFGEHPNLVMSLLNALLPLTPEQEIVDIEYLTPELMPENPLRKYSIVDVRCKDKQGRQFLVEMQMIWSSEYKRRVLFNATKVYARQLDRKENYKLLQPVYSLNLVNEIFEPDLKGFYHHYQLVHAEHSNRVIDGLQLVFVELPKFKPNTYTEKKMQALWLRFLTEIDEKSEKLPEELLTDPSINQAIKVIEEGSFSRDELYWYDEFWDGLRVERALTDGVREEATEKALKEGREEGLKRGLEQGKNEGLKLGRNEGLELGRNEGLELGRNEGEQIAKRQMAANMKKDGLPLAVIEQYTGLTQEEIESI